MSGSGSAFWGDLPANQYDRNILAGVNGIPADSKIVLPPKLDLPPGSPTSQATQTIIGTSFAIALVIFITGGRLAARIFLRGQKFGPDDIVIIPGAVSNRYSIL